MEPQNGGLQDDFPFQRDPFSGSMLFFGGSKYVNPPKSLKVKTLLSKLNCLEAPSLKLPKNQARCRTEGYER